MVTIFRIENVKGIGPYQNSFDMPPLLYNLTESHTDDESHPAPHRDEAITDCGLDGALRWELYLRVVAKRFNIIKYQLRFAFKSKKQMQEWFSPSDIKIMEDCGYYVNEISVHESHIFEWKKQIAFIYDLYA